MKKSIEDFKSALSRGGVRPTMYEVTFSIPQTLTANSNVQVDDVRGFTMLTKAAAIPGETVTTISVGLPAGAVLKLPGSRIYEPWNCTVISDGTMRLRSIFELWSDRIIGREAPLRELDGTAYLSTVEVTQLGRDGEPLRAYTLHHAYPISVSPQQLGYEGEMLSEFQLTWNYHYHTATSDFTDREDQ